jgi:hypothetical protein
VKKGCCRLNHPPVSFTRRNPLYKMKTIFIGVGEYDEGPDHWRHAFFGESVD